MNWKLLPLFGLVFLLQSCEDFEPVWNLPRSNAADSLQNQNPDDKRAPVASFSSSSRSVEAGKTISFLNTSTKNPSGVRWYFPGATPSTSNSGSPSVTFPLIRKYDVALAVENEFGGDSIYQTGYIESYYYKSFSNNLWDGWTNNGWSFSSSLTCTDCILAWQNSGNTPLTYTISKSFTNVSTNARLEFYYYIYSPGGTITAKVNNVPVFTRSGYGSGTASVNLNNPASFTLAIEALVGYTQSIYVDAIRIKP